MGKIIQLKDKQGGNQYPVTSSEAVGMSDGSGSLDKKLKSVDGNIAQQGEKLAELEGGIVKKLDTTTYNTDKTAMQKDIDDLKKFHGSDFCVGEWTDSQIAPEALSVKGSVAFALNWYPWLVDMTDNAGPAVTKARTLKKNNWFRYGVGGGFAPAVCITQEDYDLCNAELYLDAGHTQKYCEAGAFDAEAFYNEYGVSQPLYSASGTQISHIRRPWETTNKDLGQFIGRKDTIYICDSLPARNGNLLKGVFGSQSNYDGAQFGQFKLPPTGISPTPVCTINNKTRSFFYLMKGDAGCQSGAGDGGCADMFAKQNIAYPRAGDMQQVNDMKWSRANNVDVDSPVPFAEGGFFALNAFLTCMEVGYGSKALHTVNMFSNGVSSTDSCSSEETWMANGGVRFKRSGTADWQYKKWNEQTEICVDGHGKKSSLSAIINREYPKVGVNEGQIAASYAAELNIPAGQEFEMYGETYWYQNVEGAASLLDGEMNCRVYKKVVGAINGFLSDGTPQTWDCEVVLRIAIMHGVNASGDVFAYWGGGYEQVGHCTQDTSVSRYNNPVYLYIEPNQSKWVKESNATISESEKFSFEDKYIYLGKTKNIPDTWMLQRMPYSGYIAKKGGGLYQGECAYGWLTNYWGSLGQKSRIAVRFRGYAGNSACSPRFLSAYNFVWIAFRSYAGSAQVLLGAAECNSLQAQ